VPTLAASVAPVVVGSAVASHERAFRLAAALGALVVALAIQIGTNFYNDVQDFVRGADTASRRGPLRATQSGLLSPRQALAGAYVCFAVAALAGLAFAAQYGWPVLAAGALAIASGLAYTGGPWPLGYHALGEVFVFLFFGVLAVVGTAYVQLGRVVPLAVAASVPVGLLCSAILVVNNLRDIEPDGAAGKRTLAVRIGPRLTRALYAGCLAGAGLVPGVLRALGWIGPWFWLPWVALVPLGAVLAGIVWQAGAASRLNRALGMTAQLHLLFAMLFALSLTL
jgi:1,4-dihydroxy-2-naphthoate octaprenyltransferase